MGLAEPGRPIDEMGVVGLPRGLRRGVSGGGGQLVGFSDDECRESVSVFGFLTVGISLKLALFPLHLWLPNAYTYAPSAVTAFIASTATKVAVYMLLRFFFTIFGGVFSFDVMQLDRVLLPLALMAIFTMSLVAIFQTNVKRMLAYSSVAQIGYMILGISMASVTGLTAGILHLFNHAMIKGSLFMAMGCVMYRVGSVELEAMRGLAKKMPWTMAAFVAGGFSLIGIPLTVGFISKWYLILGALERGSWWWMVAALVLTTSLMAVVYIWRVVEVAYFQDAPGEGSMGAASTPSGSTGVGSASIGPGEEIVEAPLALLIPTWVLIVVNFYFGINASFTTEVAGSAARTLMGMAP